MLCRWETHFLLWTTVSLVVVSILFTSMYFINEDPQGRHSRLLILFYLIVFGVILAILIIMCFAASCIRGMILYEDIREEAVERLVNEMREETSINTSVNKD